MTTDLVGSEFERQETDPEKLMTDYRRRIETYTVEKIVADALADTAAFNFQPRTVPVKAYEHFLVFASSPLVESKLCEMLWKMTEFLAATIAGAAATKRSIEDTRNKVDVYQLRTSVREFNAFAREQVDMTGFTDLSILKRVVSVNLFFTELHDFLVEGWEKALREST